MRRPVSRTSCRSSRERVRVWPAFLLMLAAVLLATACATREELIAKSADVPAGIDLSGLWELREDSLETVARIDKAGMEAAGGLEKINVGRQKKPEQSRRKSTDGALVHVFLETGSRLKITQTDYGLFISFDRAIVEEYRFGEKREISVGPVAADRVSGWEKDSYRIETLDKDGAKLIESYRLVNGGSSLIREVVVVRGEERLLDIEQMFDRI